MTIEEEIKQYKEGVRYLYQYLSDEELEAQRRMITNSDYYQAVLTTTSKLKDIIKNTFSVL
jgi:hypothetical protein